MELVGEGVDQERIQAQVEDRDGEIFASLAVDAVCGMVPEGPELLEREADTESHDECQHGRGQVPEVGEPGQDIQKDDVQKSGRPAGHEVAPDHVTVRVEFGDGFIHGSCADPSKSSFGADPTSHAA